ncbi:MAG: calcium/sodium antiporter [Nitrospinota bacterium]
MEAFFAGLPSGWNVVWFIAGCALVIWGASKFLNGAVFLARAANVPKVVVGATIVSVATTFPEFSVSFSAATMGKPLLAVGNAVGSYICNIGLIVGLSALARAIFVPRRIFRALGFYAMAAVVALAAFSAGETVGRTAGILFTLGFIGFLVFNWRLSLAEEKPDKENAQFAKSEWVRQSSWFLVGGVSVGAGSILLVQNGALIARHLGVSELIVGLTIVAVGTSLPEISLGVMAMIKGHSDLSLGNILGANVLNILWVVGASALVRPLPIVPQTRVLDLPFTLVMIGLLLTMGLSQNRVSRWGGGLLLGIYILYLALMGVFFF